MAQGFAGLNVGRTKTGKTTFCKYLLTQVPETMEKHIYDVNNEYKEFYTEPFVTFSDFMERIKPVTNSFILIEEATIFFEVRSTDKILKEMLVRKRHTGNVIYLNFHSISAIPKYVFNLVNYVTIFKTNDTDETVKKKFDGEKFMRTYQKVRGSDDQHARITLDLYS